MSSFVGSRINLISKLGVRYEGVLNSIDRTNATIAVANVKSMGTEDRPTKHYVQPRDYIYEYIIFRADDIAELTVVDAANANDSNLNDPAIVSVKKGNAQAPATPSPAPPPMHHPNGSGWAAPGSYANAAVGGYGGRGGYGPPHQQQGAWNRGRGGYQQQGYGYNRGGYARGGQQQHQGQRGAPRGRGQPRGAAGGQRGGAQRTPIKFDTDFDFEAANENFEKELKDLGEDLEKKATLDKDDDEVRILNAERADDDDDDEKFYDRSTSFFDKISCEALEREEGKNTRVDWRHERQTNTETFGQSSVRRGYGYRGRYNRGRGYYNNNRQRNQQPNSQAATKA